jgi:CRISPR-associated protein Csm2
MGLNYYDEDGKNVRPELFVGDAQRSVESFMPSREGGRDGVSKHQLRRFYNQVLLIRDKIEASDAEEECFRRELPFLRMLISKAYYARSRKKVNDGFYQFMRDNLSEIHSLRDFRTFTYYFEAIVAYGDELK